MKHDNYGDGYGDGVGDGDGRLRREATELTKSFDYD